jgi:hypothetical protein
MREVGPGPVLRVNSDIEVEISVGMREIFQCNDSEPGDNCEGNDALGVFPYPETLDFL